MNVLVTGASGLIGSALVSRLAEEGHQVIPLRRRASSVDESVLATWHPRTGQVDLSRCPPLHAVVHLAGENIAQRWTAAARERIRRSRVEGTRLLSEALAQRLSPTSVLVCASAIGLYGDRGDELLDEQSRPGSGFLPEVCQAWEAATEPARARGLRVVRLRLGVVLTPRGGALAKMLPAFRFGLGGPLGHGRQYWSWVVLDDLLEAILHTLHRGDLSGAVNVVAPHPVTNREFSRTLAAVLHRPCVLRTPAWAVKLLLGQMGEEALLASTRVRPVQLERTGFRFQFPELRPALEHLLKHSS